MEGSHCERNHPPCVDGMAEGRFCLPSVIKDEKNEKKRVRAALHQSPWWACSNLTEADFPSSDRVGRIRVEERRPACALLNRRLSVAVDSISRYAANTHTGRTLVGVRRFRQLDIDHTRVRPSQGMHRMLFHLDRVYPSGGSGQLV
jgi:hypothetical protein